MNKEATTEQEVTAKNFNASMEAKKYTTEIEQVADEISDAGFADEHVAALKEVMKEYVAGCELISAKCEGETVVVLIRQDMGRQNLPSYTVSRIKFESNGWEVEEGYNYTSDNLLSIMFSAANTTTL